MTRPSAEEALFSPGPGSCCPWQFFRCRQGGGGKPYAISQLVLVFERGYTTKVGITLICLSVSADVLQVVVQLCTIRSMKVGAVAHLLNMPHHVDGANQILGYLGLPFYLGPRHTLNKLVHLSLVKKIIKN